MPCVCLSFLKLAALPKDPSSRSNMKSRQFQSSSNGVWTLYIIWENLWECYLALLGTSVLPLLTFSDCSHESYVKNKTPQQRGHGVGWGGGAAGKSLPDFESKVHIADLPQLTMLHLGRYWAHRSENYHLPQRTLQFNMGDGDKQLTPVQ